MRFGNLKKDDDKFIFFYDSDCGFCSKFIKLIHFIDLKKKIYFAPIYGENYRKIIKVRSVLNQSESTSVFYNGQSFFVNFQGILEVIRHANFLCGHFFSCATFFLSESKKNEIYQFISERRQSFVKHKTCALPSESMRSRMLR